MWEIVGSPDRGSYRRYAALIRYFLSRVSLPVLVALASQEDFASRLRQIDAS
jgi:hypothetical protein